MMIGSMRARALAATVIAACLLATAPAWAEGPAPAKPPAAAPAPAAPAAGEADVETSSAAAAEELEDPAETARIAAEKARLDALIAKEESKEPGSALEKGHTSALGYLVNLFLVMVAICMLAYLLLGKAFPRMLQMSPTARRSMLATPSRGMIEVVDRLPLDPKHSALVLKVGGAYFLVGVSEQHIEMLSRLDGEDVQALAAAPDAKPVFGRFAELFARRAERKEN